MLSYNWIWWHSYAAISMQHLCCSNKCIFWAVSFSCNSRYQHMISIRISDFTLYRLNGCYVKDIYDIQKAITHNKQPNKPISIHWSLISEKWSACFSFSFGRLHNLIMNQISSVPWTAKPCDMMIKDMTVHALSHMDIYTHVFAHVDSTECALKLIKNWP